MTDFGWRSRRRDPRTWIIGAVIGAVVVLGVGIAVAEPYVDDWWITRSACGGSLPRDVLDGMGKKPMDDDGHLYGQEETVDARHGRYRCEVSDGDDGRGYRFRASAYTTRDDIDAHLAEDFSDHEAARLALPGKLPGYETPGGDLVLTLPCPGLGKDGSGEPRELHTRAHIPGYLGDADSGDQPGIGKSYDAGTRAAVAFAGKASEKLRCGAKPLKAPAKVTRPQPVPLKKTAGTPCSALARSPLDAKRAWSAEVRISAHAPVGSCVLERPGDGAGSGRSGGKKSGERGGGNGAEKEALDLTAFYGDWSDHLWKDTGRKKPWVSGTGGWATARCHGAHAAFRIRMLDGEGAPRGAAPVADPKEMRSLLAGFAEEQTRRRGCTQLHVPSRISPERQGDA